MKKIIAGFSDSGALLGSGIMCEGQKYMTLKADPRSVYGRKVCYTLYFLALGYFLHVAMPTLRVSSSW